MPIRKPMSKARKAAEWITGTPQKRRLLDRIDFFDKINEMSDEDFNKAVKSGELTNDQIRSAGEYFLDTWIGDVWREGDHDDEPDPTYEEFYANPSRYGHTEGQSFGNHLDRYRGR